jgi:hypothetical protein
MESSTTTGTGGDNGPTGSSGSIDAATDAFAKILTGDADTQDESEAQAEGDEPQAVEDPEPEAQAEDEESDPDDDEEDGDEGEPQTTYTVKVDGQEVEVTVDELVKGYSRTQDYTRKTMAVAEERKALRAEAESIRTERAQYAQLLSALQQQVAPQVEAEPDWARLRAEDPIEYAAQWADWQQRQQRLQAIQYEQQRVAQMQQREQVGRMQEALEAEAAQLSEAIPEWRDPARARAEKGAVVEYAAKIGFTPEELRQVYDHRAVVALRKAMLYDRLMEKRGQIKPVQKPSAPALRPGSQGTVTRKVSDVTRAKQRLAKTGSVRDAASVFEQLLG